MENEGKKDEKRIDKDRKRSAPDTGQGPSGHLGSDGDHGRDLTSGNDDKSDKSKKRKKNSSPVPIKHQD
jgi:hypothetical protein